MFLFPVFLLVVLIFINRYFLGIYLKIAKRGGWDRVAEDFEPTVTVVVPMFNEGERITKTLASLLALDYPKDKLEITVIDDCSSDDSVEWAEMALKGEPRGQVFRNVENLGKRRSINRAVRLSCAEVIVSVDSDVEVDPQAVRQLVRRFTSPEIGAVGGRVNISNPNESWLTRMQVIKYYFGYEYMKNLERAFHSVMCLSGCLSAYRRSVLVELEPILEQRSGARRSHQVRRGSIPDPSDREGRLPDLLDLGCDLLHRRAQHPEQVLLATAPLAPIERHRLLRRDEPRVAATPPGDPGVPHARRTVPELPGGAGAESHRGLILGSRPAQYQRARSARIHLLVGNQTPPRGTASESTELSGHGRGDAGHLLALYAARSLHPRFQQLGGLEEKPERSSPFHPPTR